MRLSDILVAIVATASDISLCEDKDVAKLANTIKAHAIAADHFASDIKAALDNKNLSEKDKQRAVNSLARSWNVEVSKSNALPFDDIDRNVDALRNAAAHLRTEKRNAIRNGHRDFNVARKASADSKIADRLTSAVELFAKASEKMRLYAGSFAAV